MYNVYGNLMSETYQIMPRNLNEIVYVLELSFSMSMVMDFCIWKKVWSEWSMAERGVSTKPG